MLEAIRRMAATLAAMLQTRAELLAVEVEEEVLRAFTYLLVALLALTCLGIALLLAVLLIVVLFWDTYRVVAIAGLMVAFGVVAIAIGVSVCRCYRQKPKFLSNTLGELSKDIEMFKPTDKGGAQ